MMGGTTVGVPCSVRDAVAKTAAAAKMPAPAAYIVPTKEPNAFAAGRGRDRVVAVTQGLVDLLDRCRPSAEISRDRVSTTYLASIACLRVEAKQPHHAIATPHKT